ncbi:MAG: AAA family ATPase [Desulfobacterales bacterium]|jgi:uncharacterized protein YhaN|nr:AAA family ATPase [Desulfobacterales bacterium]
MKIQGLHIDGFGVFHDASISDLNSRLVLVQGDNEAGKSTLLGFIRTVLFGFPRANAKDELFYPPVAGGMHGGRLSLLLQGGESVTVSRGPGKQGGLVTVEGADGLRGGAELLGQLLGGVGYEVFRNIFAFSLSELQTLDSLQKDGVRHAVYGAGFGTGMATLSRAKKQVQGRLESLFRSGGSKPLINAALTALNKVHQALQDAGRQVGRYDALLAEKQSLEQQISRLAETLDEHRGQALRFNSYSRLWPEWLSHQENETQLSTLTPVVIGFPEDGLARYEKELSACRQYEAELAALTDRAAQCSGQIESLALNRALADQAPSLRALLQEKAAYLDKLKRLPLLTHEKAVLESNHKDRLNMFGRGKTESEILAIDRSVLVREEIRSFQHRFLTLANAATAADHLFADRTEHHASVQRATQDAANRLAGLASPQAAPDPEMLLKLKQGRDRFADGIQEISDLTARLARSRQALEQAIGEIDATWTESDLDRFDASVAARHLVDEFSHAMAYAQEAARIADAAGREKAIQLERAREKLNEATAARRPVPSLSHALLLTAPGILAAAGTIWWHWPEISSPPAITISTLCIGYLLCLLVILRKRHHVRALQTRTIETFDEQVTEGETALQAAQQAASLANTRLSNISADWRAHLEKMGIRATLPPTLAASLFFKIEAARQRQSTLTELADRFALVQTAQAAYIATAGMLAPLSAAAKGPAPGLLQAVDGFIARLPAMEEKRAVFYHAQEAAERHQAALQSARASLDTARNQRDAVFSDMAATTRAWQNWLATHGLPDTLSPDTALEALDTLSEIATDIGRRNHLALEIQQLEADLTEYRQTAEALVTRIGCPVAGQSDQWPALIEELSAELETTLGNQREKTVLEAQLAAIGTEQTAVRKKLSIGQENLRELLHEAGTKTEADYRHRAAAFAERRRLLNAIAENEKNMRRITGETDITALKTALSRLCLAEIEALERAQAEAVSERMQQMDTLRNKRAALDREIDALLSDEDVAKLRAEEARLLADIQAHAFDWCRYALAGHLLERAQARYETENQPRVLQDAASFFQSFTRGRYVRLVAPMGEETIQAVTATHRSLRPEALSRGTAEQLYLAIRFGFIRHRARHSEPLPVIMDDILVNFDPGRAQAAAEAIAELSQTHQVLFFTCHPETVAQFQRTDTPVQLIRLNAPNSETP